MKRLTALTLSAALTSALTVAPSAWADKPEWAGNKEKPSAEQVDAHKAEMKAKRGEAGRGADEDSHYADKKGIKYVALVGEDEILSGLLTVKDMQTGNQEKYTFDELMKKIT